MGEAAKSDMRLPKLSNQKNGPPQKAAPTTSSEADRRSLSISKVAANRGHSNSAAFSCR